MNVQLLMMMYPKNVGDVGEKQKEKKEHIRIQMSSDQYKKESTRCATLHGRNHLSFALALLNTE
jgi:hypothetical protein